MAKSKQTEALVIKEIKRSCLDFYIVGESPLIFNSMSAKAKGDLLMPKKKTKAEKEQSLKHDPISEFRDSIYREKDTKAKTEIVFPSTGFKAALATAALETPGATKSQIGRLTYVEGEYVPIYGVPDLFMTVVRSADMNRTPDIRSRAILAEWACVVTINFVTPTLNDKMIATLLANAGQVVGIGDFRQEKGKGNYGRFRVVQKNDPTFRRISNSGMRVHQIKALNNPVSYDTETSELYAWYENEIKARGRSSEVKSLRAVK